MADGSQTGKNTAIAQFECLHARVGMGSNSEVREKRRFRIKLGITELRAQRGESKIKLRGERESANGQVVR